MNFLLKIGIFIYIFLSQIQANKLDLESINTSKDFKYTYHLLYKSNYWTYVNSASFKDGGSISCSFMNENGEVFHLWMEPLFLKEFQKFFIKLTYNDNRPIEITPNSDLEKKISEILSKSYISEKIKPYQFDLELVQKTLKNRKLHLRAPDLGPAPSKLTPK